MDPMVVVENQTGQEVCLAERLAFAPTYSCSKNVAPNSREEFSAYLFLNHNHTSMRASVIHLIVGKEVVIQTLTPQAFVRFCKLIITVDSYGWLVVRGVEAKLTDLCRLRGFGFLGREYRGRAEIRIGRWRLQQSQNLVQQGTLGS